MWVVRHFDYGQYFDPALTEYIRLAAFRQAEIQHDALPRVLPRLEDRS